MNYQEALGFLHRLAPEEEGWVTHSVKTAEAAFRISKALRDAGSDTDPERVRVEALLHDVGRSEGHGHLHGWSGYKLMKEQGLEEYARPCVSHWLKGRTPEEIMHESPALDPEFVDHVFRVTGCAEFTLDERIVALADSMTSFDLFVTVRERYRDARIRYGESDWLDTNERISEEIKSEFDRALGRDLYELFPEIKN